jgi:hypothetical protein
MTYEKRASDNTQFATSLKDGKSICNFFDRHFFSFANANKHFTFKQAFVRHGSNNGRQQAAKPIAVML